MINFIKNNRLVLLSVLFFVLVYWLVPFGARRDVNDYIYMYTSLSPLLIIKADSLGFLLLSRFFQFFHASYHIFFLFVLLFAVFIKVVVSKKLSDRPLFSVFLYACLFFPVMELITIRAGLAVAVFMWAIDDIVQRRPAKFFLKVLLASVIHYSAFVYVLCYFFSGTRKGLAVWVVAIFTALLFVFFSALLLHLLVPLSNYLPAFIASKFYNYVTHMVHENIIFNPIYLLQYLFAVFVLISLYDKLNSLDLVLFKIYLFGIFLFYLTSSVPAVPFRLAPMMMISSIILFPNLLKYLDDRLGLAFKFFYLLLAMGSVFSSLRLFFL